MGAEAALARIWSRSGGPAELALWPLSLVAFLYGAAAAARVGAYRRGILRSESLPVPVISVGNLAVGGTGKTPLVIALARALGERDLKVGVLTRGYKGTHEGRGGLLVADAGGLRSDPATAGDEAVLLAWALPGVPVAVGTRRAEAGRLLLDAAKVDLLILDDGFQHLALTRDADVVLVDGRAPLGNGRVLPRGPLRERPRSLARADRVVARVGTGETVPDLAALTAAPVLAARTRVTGVVDGAGAPADDLAGTPVLALAGIARPERFRATVAGLGAEVAAFVPFPDHAPYGPADVASLAARAEAVKAERVVVTAKDAVKLVPLWPEDGIPLRVVEIALEVAGPDGVRDWAGDLLALAEARHGGRRA